MRTSCAAASEGAQATMQKTNAGRSIRSDRIAYPFDLRRIEPLQQHYVEAAGHLGFAGEIESRRRQQARALAPVDAFGRASESAPRPQPHFDENERPAFPEDEVDFAEAAAPVGLDQLQALAFEEGERQRLGPRSRGLRHVKMPRDER